MSDTTTLSPKAQAAIKVILALGVDVLNEVDSAEVNQVVTELQTGLVGFTPGNKPALLQIVTDAATAVETITADITSDQKILNGEAFAATIAEEIASGKSSLGAVVAAIFKKHTATPVTSTTETTQPATETKAE